MKIKLFDFQRDALHAMREKLVAASSQASSTNPQVIVFSAPTGSGKTIIMTALFEAILAEPDEELAWPLDWKPQPDAVILWISDMPALNEQTRMKIESKSNQIKTRQLVMIDAAFDAERLQGGHIYFINTQKLGEAGLLTKLVDGRQHSIWETLTNTARAIPKRFYVIIDEAHRGMAGPKAVKEAQTLMQRFLMGFKDVGLVPMPLVIGVSATPKRFTQLLESDHLDRTVYKVAIPTDEVRLSGLLKDRVLIAHPEVVNKAEMALLQEAAKRWSSMTTMWSSYCKDENEPTVWPILVVQVENGTDKQITKTDLSDVLTAIEAAIGRRLNEGEVAHAMHDTGDMDVGGRRVRKVDPTRIEEDKSIGVVLFKTNLSTGWDCPRAEVMMSFRRAEDHTYIAQLLGRMVRTPLARRVEREAALNDVHLFLPHFDGDAVDAVIKALSNPEDAPPAETGSARDLVVLNRRPGLDDVFKAFEDLVTYRVNAARAQNPIRRYMAISRGLAQDGLDADAVTASKAQMVAWMNAQMATIKASEQYEATYKSVAEVVVKQTAVQGGDGVPLQAYSIEASDIDIDRQFEEGGRVLSHGLHTTYWTAHSERDAFEVKTELIILTRQASAMSAIETLAEAEFNRLYDKHKKAISKLVEHRRTYYERLCLATPKPTAVPWHLPDSINFRRKPSDPVWDRHLYIEDNGKFRAELKPWEEGVLKRELAAGSGVVAWLRNVDRQPWSLEIPYESGGQVVPMFPDLVVVRKVGDDYVFDILEPHNPALGDNFEKAVGFAKFAEQHGALFGRIEMLRAGTGAAGKGSFVGLDFNQTSVRKKVMLITSNPQLDALFDSDGK
ncbi:DEAD/DEAH box helicase [Ideonella alba]|uniref:DEAD/DEAH box helicase family protein n=1 Tax=Ideonella alba TaxID=2824118 RepID=A0A940YDG5_9BURK|nr:DEAD/DEAH box helicase family protein [Ideonella alba]MBQ0933598.1 DEAD/DEAH box helicase family protein [Ideonella alba]